MYLHMHTVLFSLCLVLFFILEPAEVQSFSAHLKCHYKHTRFIFEKEEWPPDQSKHFSSLTMIHHKPEKGVCNSLMFTSLPYKKKLS